MFRAAFPNAPDHEEKIELLWVKENYDLSANNGGPHNPGVTRLAGTWVSPALARVLGDTYALGDLITAVVDATPDPNANYRRSAKSSAPAKPAEPVSVKPVSASTAAATLPTPSPTAGQPNPPKRRKEGSPAPLSVPVSPPTSPTKALPRRSSRTRSPAPRSSIGPFSSVSRTPKVQKTVRREEVQILTPGGSDLTVLDEETEVIEDRITGSELHEQDVAEQQALVQKLKAERDAAKKQEHEVADEDEDEESEAAAESPSTGVKRVRKDEDEELKTIPFNPKEPEVGERAIATNARVGRFQLQPRTRQLAWGAAVFAFGMGAV
ncbi:hypothetical protein H0H81_008949 [Sphagnurus paluster]|uniref:HTH APSES-type domain-containing protein n=1 Tax=Sphagnurus paluster TaxID=117069 RepID=A0A9P7G130_9AGAR|nr:hypothetical protein H0H81_008949 [Sphagnurus paluster]